MYCALYVGMNECIYACTYACVMYECVMYVCMYTYYIDV